MEDSVSLIFFLVDSSKVRLEFTQLDLTHGRIESEFIHLVNFLKVALEFS